MSCPLTVSDAGLASGDASGAASQADADETEDQDQDEEKEEEGAEVPAPEDVVEKTAATVDGMEVDA